jgi:hypothetical protein
MHPLDVDVAAFCPSGVCVAGAWSSPHASWRRVMLRSLPTITALLLVACESRAGSIGNPPAAQDESAVTPGAATTVSAAIAAPVAPVLSPLAQLFDTVVTVEALFPDPAQRALYRAVPPETREEQRVYSFELRPQPGMEPERHFHLVSVAIGAAAKGRLDPSPASLEGPNGTFNELAVRTSDGRYDVSVSEGNLMPDSVALPVFDLTRAAKAIAARYAGLRAAR